MENLNKDETNRLSQSVSIYATLRLWGLFSSFRRDSTDGKTLWEQSFENWKADFLTEMTGLREICDKAGLEESCLTEIDDAVELMKGVDSYHALTERQIQRRMKKWQITLSGRLRDKN